MGGRRDLQEEIQDAEELEAGRRGGWGHQEAFLTVLPSEDGALPYRAVSSQDEEQAHPQCRRCRCPTPTRDRLLKVRPEWKAQQKILWAEVWKEMGKGKSRFMIRDLLADRRCSQAVVDFLSTTDVGRLVPAEEDAGIEVSPCRNGSVGSG